MDKRKVDRERHRLEDLLDRAAVPMPQRDALAVVVDNLALMRIKLEEASAELKDAPLTVEYDNGGGQRGTRANPFFKVYLDLWRAYMAGLEKLTSSLPKDLQEEAAGDDLSVLAQVVEMKKKGMA